MSEMCKALKMMQERIKAGEDPEAVIPYSFSCTNDEEFIEILHYAVQVLPEDSPRRKTCLERLKEYAGR